jgi:hypothetical protein
MIPKVQIKSLPVLPRVTIQNRRVMTKHPGEKEELSKNCTMKLPIYRDRKPWNFLNPYHPRVLQEQML